MVDQKQRLRAKMRTLRRAHVSAQPDSIRALLFLRPPAQIADLAPVGSIVGLYHPLASEAPTHSYARWLQENGRVIALPWFADRASPMRYRLWRDPQADSGLEPGPLGQFQPPPDADEVTPDLVFVPLLAFTPAGDRLGQGGGYYDRWLEANPDAIPIGLAWDSQLIDSLPIEAHDRRLRAVVTPTRLYEGEA